MKGIKLHARLALCVFLIIPVAGNAGILRDVMASVGLAKPAPAPVKAPVVVPAAKMSSLAAVVVTEPLFAVVPVPDAEVVTSSGFTLSSPLYSVMRRSTKGVDVLNVTVTAFVPPARFVNRTTTWPTMSHPTHWP